MQVTGRDFDQSLHDLAEARHVKTTEKADVVQVTITAAGRKSLKALPDLPPIIADIDGDTPVPDLPAGIPATDELQPDDDVMSRLGPGSRRTTALELIAAHPGITVPELADRMNLKQNYLYRLLPELVGDGLVRKDGRGWHPATASEAPAA